MLGDVGGMIRASFEPFRDAPPVAADAMSTPLLFTIYTPCRTRESAAADFRDDEQQRPSRR